MKRILYILMLGLGAGFTFAREIVSVESPTFKKEELQTIQKKLGLVVGDSLSLEKVEEGIQSLYKSENQRLIFVEVTETQNGYAIRLRGTRFRRLRSLKFKNIDEEVEDNILRGNEFELGKAIDLGKLSILRERIKSEYQAKGFQFASVEVEMIEDEKSGTVDVEFSVTQNVATKVSKVDFVGVSAEDAKELKDHIPLKEGGYYSRKAMDESGEALRAYFKRNRRTTSRIEETSVKLSEDRLTSEVVFTVKMGEQYQFEFRGNEEFDEVDLRNLLTEETLSQADAPNRISEQIEKKYKKAGFHFVRVDVKTETLSDKKIQIIRFEIEENKRVIIDRVLVSGTGTLKESEIESYFIQNGPGVINRGLYWEEGIGEATNNLRLKLESLGFLSASITGPRVAFSEDKKGVELIFDIDSGNQTKFKRFLFKGNNKISEATLIKEMPYEPGDIFNWERLAECKRAAVSVYRREGYVDVQIEEATERKGVYLGLEQREADVSLTMKEGPQYFVGNIVIEGSKRTKDNVILREMALKTGDKFDPEKLQESEDNIALLQLFSRLEIVTYPNANNTNQKDIKIIVVEIKPGSGEVGLGAAYEEPRFRARSFLGVQYRNLWGLNQTASSRTELTVPLSHQQSLIPFVEYAILLGYRAPYLFEFPFTLSAQAGLDSYELSPLQGNSILQTRARIEEKIERRFGRAVTGIYRLHRYERTTLEYFEATRDPVRRETNSIGSTGPGLIVDLRDDSFNPTKGSYHTLDFEFAHPNLLSQSDIGFIMAVVRNSFYMPLSGNVGIILFGGAGYAKSIFDTPLPVARLANDLSLGGQSSLRGYSSKEYQNLDELGQKPKETAFLNARIELVTPLLDNIAGALFFDTGVLFPNMAASGRKDGLGLGFRYKTPVGPVVIDIAHGFQSRDKNVKFTFTIGSI